MTESATDASFAVLNSYFHFVIWPNKMFWCPLFLAVWLFRPESVPTSGGCLRATPCTVCSSINTLWIECDPGDNIDITDGLAGFITSCSTFRGLIETAWQLRRAQVFPFSFSGKCWRGVHSDIRCGVLSRDIVNSWVQGVHTVPDPITPMQLWNVHTHTRTQSFYLLTVCLGKNTNLNLESIIA